mgnify:FL=1
MTKKSPDAIEIMDIIRGFFYIKPNNIFSRDFCVYFYIFLRDFLYSYYIFPHDFLSKAIIRGTPTKLQSLRPPQAASSPMRRAFLESRFGQFVFHGPAASVGFTPFLSNFASQVQAFRIGAEFFQINNTVSILSAAI